MIQKYLNTITKAGVFLRVSHIKVNTPVS